MIVVSIGNIALGTLLITVGGWFTRHDAFVGGIALMALGIWCLAQSITRQDPPAAG